MPIGDHTPLVLWGREIFVEQDVPLVPQVVAFVGPRGRLAAHLGTVSTAYALWVVADAKAMGRVGSVAPRKWPIATEIPCTMNAAIATPVSTTRHR
jgi:hypothetical protein